MDAGDRIVPALAGATISIGPVTDIGRRRYGSGVEFENYSVDEVGVLVGTLMIEQAEGGVYRGSVARAISALWTGIEVPDRVRKRTSRFLMRHGFVPSKEPRGWKVPTTQVAWTVDAGDTSPEPRWHRHPKQSEPVVQPVVVGWMCIHCKERFPDQGAHDAHVLVEHGEKEEPMAVPATTEEEERATPVPRSSRGIVKRGERISPHALVILEAIIAFPGCGTNDLRRMTNVSNAADSARRLEEKWKSVYAVGSNFKRFYPTESGIAAARGERKARGGFIGDYSPYVTTDGKGNRYVHSPLPLAEMVARSRVPSITVPDTTGSATVAPVEKEPVVHQPSPVPVESDPVEYISDEAAQAIQAELAKLDAKRSSLLEALARLRV